MRISKETGAECMCKNCKYTRANGGGYMPHGNWRDVSSARAPVAEIRPARTAPKPTGPPIISDRVSLALAAFLVAILSGAFFGWLAS